MAKGLVIGGAIGYGAYALALDGGWNWLTYGVVGAFVGLLVGKPLWTMILDKNSTTVVAALKAVFGFGVCVGVYALVAKAWGGFDVSLAGETRAVWAWQPIMGAAVGALYGGFVEVDDSLDDTAARKKALAAGEAKQIAASKKKS